ncbi:uncharacterized protein LOC141691787 [Apium graveolens]|uniref:uncharacterized protein LOC141691787 n=1 Tax=Apium graveolens TaxID=4045 RepID=UPI003D7906F4
MVWDAPWLPCEDNGFLTSNMPGQLKNITVRSLMMEQENKWDEDILNDICNDRDAKLIKRIPLPAFDKKDSRFWLFDDKGVFTVKSCYRKLLGEHNTSQGIFWRKLWAIKLPKKVVNFMWRACNSCLPTAVALVTKRVQIDVKCPQCRTGNKDAIHVLFTCSFARYKWVWDKINMSAFGVHATMSLLDDWRKCIGLGAVIRDDQGNFLRAKSIRIGSLMQPLEAEALSLKEAMSWVKNLAFKKCVFETDGKQLMDACKGVQGNSYFYAIVTDCVDYCKHFENVLVDSANGVTHMLARATYFMSDVRE